MGAVPILLLVLLYLFFAAERHAINPADKILPLPGAMVDAMRALVLERDPLSGRYLFWADTLASLQRLGLGLAISTASALLVGLVRIAPPTRDFRHAGNRDRGHSADRVAANLFIARLGETAKVALIVIGVLHGPRHRRAHRRAPREQIVKAQTLGASTWQLMLRVVLPQAMPRLFQAVRLALGPAWVFLISAEAIAADIGLGYRIFLVRRYLAMDVILPYVAWIAILAALTDILLAWSSRRLFGWAHRSPA